MRGQNADVARWTRDQREGSTARWKVLRHPLHLPARAGGGLYPQAYMTEVGQKMLHNSGLEIFFSEKENNC